MYINFRHILFVCNQFTERALAHHLLDPIGGPSVEYHLSLARLKLQKHDMEEAEESLKEALQFDHEVVINECLFAVTVVVKI